LSILKQSLYLRAKFLQLLWVLVETAVHLIISLLVQAGLAMVALEVPRLSVRTRLLAVTGDTEAMMLLIPTTMAMEAPAAQDITMDMQVKMARIQTRLAVPEVADIWGTAPEVTAGTMTMVPLSMVLRVHPARTARY
jgi:hypothetical protein